jgi:phosphodiesterase/alkaline phosphatase D-like protein
MQTDSLLHVQVSRREFLATSAGAATLLQVAPAGVLAAEQGPYQATGTRVGEVTEHSAIVWTRLTRQAERNNRGLVFAKAAGRQKSPQVTVPVEEIEGACPGTPGRVRLRYGWSEDLTGAAETEWIEVTEATDFIHQFKLSGLAPNRTYHYASQAAARQVLYRSRADGAEQLLVLRHDLPGLPGSRSRGRPPHLSGDARPGAEVCGDDRRPGLLRQQ